MSKVKVNNVTQNFNSNNYLPISMLSLYSSLKGLAKLGDFIDGRVILDR